MRDKHHRTVVFLPLCHVFGRDVAITLPLISRLVPHFGESVDDLMQTMFEVAPTALFTVPRYMQKFASQVLVGLHHLRAQARRRSRPALRAQARTPPLGRRGGPGARGAQYALARTCSGRVLNKLGLDKLELAICAGAPLPKETAALWQIWGVNLVEAYGQTETARRLHQRPAQAVSRNRAMSAPWCGLAGAARR